MKELIARRMFTPLYIWLDIAFLIIFAGLLLYKKKYMTVHRKNIWTWDICRC